MADHVDVALSVDALGPQLTGIGRYCLALARGLPVASKVGSVRFFRGAHWLDDPEALLLEDWQPAKCGKLRGWLERRRQRKWYSDTIVHGPNYFLPDWAENGIITVHDLSVLRFPETHPIERVQDFESRFERSVERAAAILTDCEAVRVEVIERLGVDSDRVHAIPLGVDPAPPIPQGANSTLAMLGVEPGGYTFCLSTFEPRKRIDCLVSAYAQIDPSLRKRYPLVLAGASGWQNESLNAQIEEAQAAGWLKRLAFVPDSMRNALFYDARLFVYPSRYEGFGLPPIEAMKHGAPTIVGDADALIEVTKGAARIVNPLDVKAFSLAIAEALEDEAWQATARVQGKAVAESYCWEDCVKKTVGVYHSLAI